ncbi:MAG: hypothetical protein DRJ42_03285 [Deltaproteobacteria bacterium]|nr:MAG: hypothetical protein DRJ42_03285 [Deltaproteobacteria bacterium]
MSTLPHKLGFEAGARVLLISTPKAVRDLLAGTAHGAKVSVRGHGPFDVVLGFVARQREVERLFKQAHAVLAPLGTLWIAYPKKSSSVRTDLDRDHGWGALQERGWAPAAGIRIDETWLALRFRHDPALKALRVARRLRRAEEQPTLKIKKGGESKATVKLRRDEIHRPKPSRKGRRNMPTVSLRVPTVAAAKSAPSPGRSSSRASRQTSPGKPAVVRTPTDLRDALATAPEAKKRWGRLAPARKRELLAFIDEVKTAPARARRVDKVARELAEA